MCICQYESDICPETIMNRLPESTRTITFTCQVILVVN